MIRQVLGTKVCRIAQPKIKPSDSKSPPLLRVRRRWRSDGILHKRLDTGTPRAETFDATVSRAGTFTLAREDLTRIRLHPYFAPHANSRKAAAGNGVNR